MNRVEQLELEFGNDAWQSVIQLAKDGYVPDSVRPEIIREEQTQRLSLLSAIKFSKWKGKEDDNVYLNRLLKNASLVLPAVKPTPRSPELQKRIEILKASQQNLEYKQMVSNLSQPSVKPRSSSAVVSGLNFSVTVFASVFGCIFLLRNIIPDILVRCIIGLVCGILLLCIEIFLAVRAVNKEETKSKAN